MTHLIKNLLILLLLGQMIACTSNHDAPTHQPNAVAATTATEPTTTISGLVYDIQSGKDGHIAMVSASDTTVYAAVVSIPNLGSTEKYSELQLGDAVTLSGELLKTADENRLIVRNIDQQSPAEFCWLADGPINLYSQPNADSKNYGKFFQGEMLTVLAEPIENNNETWTKVYFRNTVKAGYEDRFADGRPMHEGIESMVGWIGGGENSIINCK